MNKDTTMLGLVTGGSRLYGTNVPTSDYDFKVIVLPSLDDVILGKPIKNVHKKPDGIGSQDNMPECGEEFEYIPLQNFMRDFYNGQSYAVELACYFSKNQGSYQMLGEISKELLHNFLTTNSNKMVGYAVAQSKNYGLKTQRYTDLVEVAKLLNEVEFKDDQISEHQDLVKKLTELDSIELIDFKVTDGSNNTIPALVINKKIFTFNVKVGYILKSVTAILARYGDRVKTFVGNKADWKALSHAIRIIEQVIELKQTGFITLPRPNAEFLVSVKTGNIPFEEAIDYLDGKFSEMDRTNHCDKLHEDSPEFKNKFDEWQVKMLKEIYGITERGLPVS